MAATINLNTSLNQHSKLKFVFYLYVKVLLGNILTVKFVFYLHNCDLGTPSMFFFLKHSMKLMSQKFRHLQNYLFSAKVARELP